MKDKKKVLLSGLAIGLAVSISIAGTLAYLTAKGDPVINTFVAGDLIGKDGFRLTEHVYDNETKTLTNQWIDKADPKQEGNRYENLAPAQTLPKDPTLFVDLEEGAEVYVFVKITNDTGVVRMLAQANQNNSNILSQAGSSMLTQTGQSTLSLLDGSGTSGTEQGILNGTTGESSSTTSSETMPVSGSMTFNIDWPGVTDNWKEIFVEDTGSADSTIRDVDMATEMAQISETTETVDTGKARLKVEHNMTAVEGNGIVLGGNEKVYCYQYQSDGAYTHKVMGKAGMDFNGTTIIKGKEGYPNGYVTTAVDINDKAQDVSGIQLGELKFQAFICQAQGFNTPEEAFRACFGGAGNMVSGTTGNQGVLSILK